MSLGKVPSPFNEVPGPQAIDAATQVMATLPAFSEGKMLGVLVVETPRGREVLKAFSGLLDGQWDVAGWAPPIFDRRAREEIEGPGEREVRRLTDLAASLEVPAVDQSPREALQARHRQHKLARAELRKTASAEELHALDQQSRADKAELRRFDEAQQPLLAEHARRVRRHAAAVRLQRLVSAEFMRRIFDTYAVRNFRGEQLRLREVFPSPPSGTGDCAAPKLLAWAQVLGFRPVALAEFWWGPTPQTGARRQGSFYPACKTRCGPLLPFMLEGLEVEPAQTFRPTPGAVPLRIWFEDAFLMVVEKPEGLLSTPGKGDLVDSVEHRLTQQNRNARAAHRLDLDTSGLLVLAKDPQTLEALHRQFESRRVHKRYLAVVSRVLTGEGVIELPLRGDLDDRPRQIVDPLHGKPATTRWKVLQPRESTTLVEFLPLTGRTHQLRVHAAHPEGLNAPIVGDRLYGTAGPRLRLHAEALHFTHPASGLSLEFHSPLPDGF